MKSLMRAVGQSSKGGVKNKGERVKKAASEYLKKARTLDQKVTEVLLSYTPVRPIDLAQIEMLYYYREMLEKHIDLLERRLIKGETIPHAEKVFSIFQPYTEMIKKGKLRPNVEIGKKVAITTDQYDLIIDWQVADNQTDNQLTISIADRLLEKYPIQSLSVDRGFSDKEDKALLELYIPEVIMPKKGKRNQKEKEAESAPAFKRLKNKHSAVESNINELEHRGLDRCPDRNQRNFNRYVGLAVTSYNLHKIGRQILKDRREQEEKERERQHQPLTLAA